MTDQLMDYFLYKSSTAYISAHSKGNFPRPIDYGMEPRAPFTACYKGFMFMLALDGNQLVLDTIFINSDVGPPINKINPVPIPDNKHDLIPKLPYIPPRSNITASYVYKEVLTTSNTISLFIHHFPQIYSNLSLPINFSGKILLSLTMKQIYQQFFDTFRSIIGSYSSVEEMSILNKK